MAVKKTVKKTSEKKICLICDKELASSSFYIHRNELITDRFGFCKKCVKENVDTENMESLIDFLRTMNIPYLRDVWKMSHDSDKDTLGIYFKNMNSLNQYKNLLFKDGENLYANNGEVEVRDIKAGEFELTEDIIDKWGDGYERAEYKFLERTYRKYTTNYVCENPVQENLFTNISVTTLLMRRATKDGNDNAYSRLSKTLSEQMNDANVKPVQERTNAQDGGHDSFGEFIKKIEETEPIPIPHDDLKDVDGIKNIIDRFFINQIKRVFNIASQEDIDLINKDM